ncbi:MAG: DUF2064 domain-containing protein [Methylococcales bacterium]|nr:DUF2064 domain-containing protein [Methylococcales bacterium]
MKPALALFVKTPGLSPLKTRLARHIGAAQAEQFHILAARCVYEVTEAALVNQGGDGYFAVAEAKAQQHTLWQAWPTLWQGEGGLGLRMRHIYQHLLARHGAVLLIGADVPQVQPEVLTAALAHLASPVPAYVYGPSDDGGFWLFGGNCPVPEALWIAVRYSQPDTGAQFLAGLPQAPVLLPVLNDVDEWPDLQHLRPTLDRLPCRVPAQQQLLQWLENLT